MTLMFVAVQRFVGAGLCACPSDVKSIRAAGRRGSLPLQDLIRDLETDDIDQQILRVGADRCVRPRVSIQFYYLLMLMLMLMLRLPGRCIVFVPISPDVMKIPFGA